ncbi:hypothetical protein BDV11DRAFT_82056 [Aspergillus similis]
MHVFEMKKLRKPRLTHISGIGNDGIPFFAWMRWGIIAQTRSPYENKRTSCICSSSIIIATPLICAVAIVGIIHEALLRTHNH